MAYTLALHPRGYELTSDDLRFSLATGLSGAPLAKRHSELAEISKPALRLGHRIISFVEYWPVLGALTAAIEQLAAHLFEKYSTLAAPRNSFWKPRTLPLADADKKMFNNGIKAIDEHRREIERQKLILKKELQTEPQKLKDKLERLDREKAVYATVQEGTKVTNPSPFTFKHTSSANIGFTRSTMEDTHFCTQIEQGLLFGVFDGHGGSKVAQYVKNQFAMRFAKSLQTANGHVHQAFEAVSDELQSDIASKMLYNSMGTTAVVSFIPKDTKFVYTATVADSEANIYRVINGKMKSIPLSITRNWSHPKEAARAAIHTDNARLAAEYPKTRDTKCLRAKRINISRAYGDQELKGTAEKPLLLHKPKISVNELQKDDILVLVSDGIKDYVKESEIVQFFSEPERDAEALIDFALEKSPQDNITAIVVRLEEATPSSSPAEDVD